MAKIYKYFSHDVLELIFQREGYCGIKCSFPKDYNDPYELFLGVDLNVPTDCLATYQDIISEIPQLPTTCFSRSPIVSPMWAHYAKEHTGFVVEFDTEELEACFEECLIDNVNYKNEPDKSLEELLLRASRIGKPRYAYWLSQATFSEAYFSKYKEWSYEQECRFVDGKNFTEDVSGNRILFAPSSCITSIIVGNKFPPDKLALSAEKAVEYDLSWYKLEIGKSYPVPYMRDEAGSAFIFKDMKIMEAEYACLSCSEPLSAEEELCPWCKITDAHKLEAASGNPFRMLDHIGGLEQYLEEVSKIGRKK